MAIRERKEPYVKTFILKGQYLSLQNNCTPKIISIENVKSDATPVGFCHYYRNYSKSKFIRKSNYRP